MRTAKKVLTFATSILLATSFSGCTSGDSATEAPKPDKIEKIGLMVQDMSNPFFSAMDKGAKEAAEKIGATLNVQDAKLDLANQNTQIDTFIQQGVDLIVVSAVDESGLQPAIERARQAGIFVVAVDTPAKGADAMGVRTVS
ncbi:substrate-binding domain-containing protein [Actinotignum sanguinis]|uniref:substrate-binding domain-containing protein n=1 Tax=Actinotignum sanguinis TaxID=1445614 RepID=UPI00254FF0FD|nr:substrate-binding domain-containing protein [Actinotignum sanguinis]MDK7197581.1 substrate-binding domain-containing protein [Actinotignum sanguinis]